MDYTDKKNMSITCEQLKALLDFLEANPEVVVPKSQGTEGRSYSKKRWEEAASILNNVKPNSMKKTSKGWRQYYNEFKHKTMKKIRQVEAHEEEGSERIKPVLTESQLRLYRLLGYETQPVKSYKNRTEYSNYTVVKRRCIELVKNGFPPALIDDEAFQGILALVPMDEESRMGLSAEKIQLMIDNNDEGDDDEDDDDAQHGSCLDSEHGQDSSMDTSSRVDQVKVEVVMVPEDCACAELNPEEHEINCPVSLKQSPFLNYFRISSAGATCTLCWRGVGGRGVDDLRRHLRDQHANIRYTDHQENVNQDSDSCFDDDPVSTPNLIKQKLKTKKSLDGKYKGKQVEDKKIEQSCLKETKEETTSPSRKRQRLEEVVLTNNKTVPIDQFKLLDRFGLYVAALLGNVSREKCIAYQKEIVDRLLKDQAAAG